MPDAVFRRLRDMVHERSGVFVPDTKRYLLENRLAQRLRERGLRDYEEYARLLLADAEGELPGLFDAVTTKETYFFREPRQLEVFEQRIVPEAAARRGGEIRVWSVACSTGEETYTLAMILREKHPGVRSQVLGSDLSEAAVEAARRGVYGSYSVRNVPPPYLARYFRPNGSGYEVEATLRKAVRFGRANLVDRASVLLAAQGADVIFCRNVLTYFSDRAKERAVANLYDALAPGGCLFVGSAESLHNVTRALRPEVIDRVVVYRKGRP